MTGAWKNMKFIKIIYKIMNLTELQQVGTVSGNTLINAECLQAMDVLIEKWVQVDAIITDPPYW